MVPPPSASIRLNVIFSCLFCSSDSLGLMTCASTAIEFSWLEYLASAGILPERLVQEALIEKYVG